MSGWSRRRRATAHRGGGARRLVVNTGSGLAPRPGVRLRCAARRADAMRRGKQRRRSGPRRRTPRRLAASAAHPRTAKPVVVPSHQAAWRCIAACMRARPPRFAARAARRHASRARPPVEAFWKSLARGPPRPHPTRHAKSSQAARRGVRRSAADCFTPGRARRVGRRRGPVAVSTDAHRRQDGRTANPPRYAPIIVRQRNRVTMGSTCLWQWLSTREA